jgi:dolichol-phosphate mannosyltransferase
VGLDLSIIVPVHNEEENILPLAEEVAAAMAATDRTYELVFVDDASTDGTWAKIHDARQLHPSVRGLRHARQAGQSAALWTGIQATTTPVLCTMDGDRQNDPADFPRLLAELSISDFVCGLRARRKDNFRRRVSAAVARYARRVVLRVDFTDTGCALRAFRRSALTGIFPFNGWHRFLPILMHGNRVRIREIPVNHRPRVAGKSKYGIWNRLGRGIVDLLAIAWYLRRRLEPVPFEEAEVSLVSRERGFSGKAGQREVSPAHEKPAHG